MSGVTYSKTIDLWPLLNILLLEVRVSLPNPRIFGSLVVPNQLIPPLFSLQFERRLG